MAQPRYSIDLSLDSLSLIFWPISRMPSRPFTL